MALLETLKVVASSINQTPTAEQARRNKLIMKLQEQLCLAQAQLGGTAYKRMRWVTIADAQGEPQRIQRPVRLKQWWYQGLTGSIFLTLRYGARPIAIAKGKTAIEVGQIAELPKVLQTIIEAVDAGELDTQLADLAAERSDLLPKSKNKSLFKKN
jgi:hypothetical protein